MSTKHPHIVCFQNLILIIPPIVYPQELWYTEVVQSYRRAQCFRQVLHIRRMHFLKCNRCLQMSQARSSNIHLRSFQQSPHQTWTSTSQQSRSIIKINHISIKSQYSWNPKGYNIRRFKMVRLIANQLLIRWCFRLTRKYQRCNPPTAQTMTKAPINLVNWAYHITWISRSLYRVLWGT